MAAQSLTIERLLSDAVGRLGRSPTSRLDAELLLAHGLGRERSYLYAHGEARPDADQRARFASLVERRAGGTPVAYLTGRREFWSLDLEVNEATLIPRPESELLVATTLEVLRERRAARVVDLGTGSGAVALAIARERPGVEVVAVDSSEEALAVARRNRERFGIGNVRLVCSDWFTALPEERRFDVVVANPPYVRSDDPHLTRGDVRFEPRDALVGGEDGLDAIRVLVAAAPERLVAGGHLLVEHGRDQAVAVAALFSAAGVGDVRTLCDLAGQPRVCAGRR